MYMNLDLKIVAAATVVVWADYKGQAGQMSLMVELENGDMTDVMSWYVDEKSYWPEQFIGMTLREAEAKFLADDQAYLRG